MDFTYGEKLHMTVSIVPKIGNSASCENRYTLPNTYVT